MPGLGHHQRADGDQAAPAYTPRATMRDKYLRQVCTGVSDGAVAATAAERYDEEWNDFQSDVLESEQTVLLAFWNPELEGSVEQLARCQSQPEERRPQGDGI